MTPQEELRKRFEEETRYLKMIHSPIRTRHYAPEGFVIKEVEYWQAYSRWIESQITEEREDSELLDFIQELMRPDDDYCEVFFAGLRNFKTGEAGAYQMESNPEKFPTQNAPTLREVIKQVRNQYLNQKP